MVARGPGGAGNGVPNRPVRCEGCARSGLGGSVFTAASATNSTRLSSSAAGGASILTPPLLDGLPSMLSALKPEWISTLIPKRHNCQCSVLFDRMRERKESWSTRQIKQFS